MSMQKIQKVTAPEKIVTDELVLRTLAKQRIDKDYVEFSQDYAPRSLGKEHSPYAKFYRDLKSNKRFMVVSGLPKVNADGTKIEVGWVKDGDKYNTRPNLFSAIVEGKRITVTCLNDQPDGRKEGDAVEWQPQLFLDGVEQFPGTVVLLPTDLSLQDTTLEWDYGICKRQIRAIQGRLREKWVFASNPGGAVRIKHNHSGNLKLNLGEYRVNDDEEIVPIDVFNQAEYPLKIGASPETFYPDAHIESSSVDGEVEHTDSGGLSWANIRVAVGSANSSNDTIIETAFRCDGDSNRWDSLIRGVYLFFTESLPDSAIITGVVLSLYGTSKDDDSSNSPNINIYSSDPISSIALADGDFDSLGIEALSAAIAFAAFNTAGYNDFTLIDVNADDFATYNVSDTYINKAGVTKLGSRNANYDVSGDVPNYTTGLDRARFRITGAEQGSNQPKLVITYTEVAAGLENKSADMAVKMMEGGLI